MEIRMTKVAYAAKPVSRFLIQYDIESLKNILCRRDIGTEGSSPASALLYTVQGEYPVIAATHTTHIKVFVGSVQEQRQTLPGILNSYHQRA